MTPTATAADRTEKGRTNAAKDLQGKRGGGGLLKWSEEVKYSPERTYWILSLRSGEGYGLD